MAGFSQSVEFTGLNEALRILRQVRNLGEDPTPLLGIFGAILERSVIKRFESSKGPGGVPWPRSKRTLGKKKRGVPSGKTLVDTGDLRNSIRYVVRPGEVEIGSDGLKNPIKAVANQFGSNRQTVVVKHTRTINSAFGVPLPQAKSITIRGHGRVTNLPARPFIGIDADDRADVNEAAREYLIGLFK